MAGRCFSSVLQKWLSKAQETEHRHYFGLQIRTYIVSKFVLLELLFTCDFIYVSKVGFQQDFP